MKSLGKLRFVLALATCLVGLLNVSPAVACSVCYGDPNSSLSHGVNAGVLVLLGFIVSVLLMIASLLIFWMKRARRLGEPAGDIGEAVDVFASDSRV